MLKKSDQDLLMRLPIAVILLDAHTKILWHNAAAQILFNNNSKAQLSDWLQIDDHQLELLKGNSKPLELLSKNNNDIHISLSLLSYEENTWLALAQDVTHLYHLERMRQDFVANVSHELRTPLTVLHGYLEALLNPEAPALQADVWKNILNQMQQQSLRMAQLIEDLLLLSRLENDVAEEDLHKPVNVPKILDRIYQDACALSGERKHKIMLETDNDLWINGAEDELTSAFSNIIFNAVHYTPAGGEIKIRWFKKQNHIYLIVKDSGIGIASEHIPRLTERFYRVDKARSRLSGGTGLGLAIVKHVLYRHHAQLKINSKLGEGSEFCCEF